MVSKALTMVWKANWYMYLGSQMLTMVSNTNYGVKDKLVTMISQDN